MQTTGSSRQNEMDRPRELRAEHSASAEKEAMNVTWGMAEGVPREVVAFELDLSRLIQL